jgi:hypothetical protein
MTHPDCLYCGGTPNGTWCCERAELEMLRFVVDQTIRALDSEVAAPMTIGECPEKRALLSASRDRLAAARRAA